MRPSTRGRASLIHFLELGAVGQCPAQACNINTNSSHLASRAGPGGGAGPAQGCRVGALGMALHLLRHRLPSFLQLLGLVEVLDRLSRAVLEYHEND